MFEGFELEPVNGIAIDAALSIQGDASAGEALQHVATCARTWNLFDAQIEEIAVAPAAGEIGTGLLGYAWCSGIKWIDHEKVRLQGGCRPLGQAAEVGKITDTPALCRSRGVKLHGPAPLASTGWQPTLSGAHDQVL